MNLRRHVLNSRARSIAVAVAAGLCVIGGTAAVTASAVNSSSPTSGQSASSADPSGVTMAPMTVSASATGASGPKVSTQGFPSGPAQPGIFTDRCAYSHSAADDPILAPNDPGAAMHHDFYGNASTSASSTAAALVGGSTTCTTSADASAYWTPVVYQNGAALKPGPALIYWRKPARDREAVQTVPVGLEMIAGDENATAPQSTDVVRWTCSGVATDKGTATPHNCSAGTQLRLIVTFPSCWDGHTLSGGGQTNVVYRSATGCPSSHPIQIPQIVFHVNYPTANAADLTVSMTPTMQGSTDTEHVDFISGWTQTILNGDVSACVATSTRCGPVTGPDAVPRGPATANKTK
jgi:Domain of unknown function (DUF1996)